MAKIKIEDLPKDNKITEEEMKAIRGGVIGDCGMPHPFGWKVDYRLLLPAVHEKGIMINDR